jgi:hypothetical protein
MSPTLSAYTNGMVVNFEGTVAGISGAATLNIDTIGAAAITKNDGATAPDASHVAIGESVELIYDGTSFRLPNSGGSSAVSEIFFAGVIDAIGFTSGFCAVPDSRSDNDRDCETDNSAHHRVGRDFTITGVGGAVGNGAWTTTDACDVSIVVDGTPDASTILEFGGVVANGAPAELDAEGDAHQITGLSISVSAGSRFNIGHATPADTTNCNDGAACACTGATGSYQYSVFGTWD